MRWYTDRVILKDKDSHYPLVKKIYNISVFVKMYFCKRRKINFCLCCCSRSNVVILDNINLITMNSEIMAFKFIFYYVYKNANRLNLRQIQVSSKKMRGEQLINILTKHSRGRWKDVSKCICIFFITRFSKTSVWRLNYVIKLIAVIYI